MRCSTGHTEDIAGIIAKELGDAADPRDIGDIEVGKLTEFDSLIVGKLCFVLVDVADVTMCSRRTCWSPATTSLQRDTWQKLFNFVQKELDSFKS